MILSDLSDLAKYSVTWSVAWSLCDSWASYYFMHLILFLLFKTFNTSVYSNRSLQLPYNLITSLSVIVNSKARVNFSFILSALTFALRSCYGWSHVDHFLSASYIGSKSRCLPTPPTFDAPVIGESPSEYCHAIWYQKTRMIWLPDGEKHWRLLVLEDSRTELNLNWTAWRQTEAALA